MVAKAPITEALSLHQAGRLAEAEVRYRQILAGDPAHAEALHGMGLLAYQAQRYETAVRLIGDSVRAQGDNAAAHVNLGNALAMLRRFAEAEDEFRRGLALDATQTDAWFNLGNALREQDRMPEAETAYRRAAALAPNHVGALNNLANLFLLGERFREAAEALLALGNVLQDVGRTADAAAAYERARALAPDDGLEVKLALLAPALPISVAEIDATRARLSSGIAALAAKGVQLPDPLRFAGSAIFYTPYHGRNDRELRAALAELYLRATPGLAQRAPHCANPARASERIRIGFLSRYFQPEHPMTKLFGGIADALDRERFHVTVFRFDAASVSPPAAEVVTLANSLDAARRTIADARQDVLFYTDIGMEPMSYFLAFARLAPVQCVTFGHPVTTGIPTMDYFISAAAMEPADADDHYTETLVRLSTVPAYFRPPPAATAAPTRRDLGIPADAHVYFCAQNPIKYHPDFDAVLAEILRRDPKGVLVLTASSKAPQLCALLQQRLRQSMPEAADRIAWLPFLDLSAMLGFLDHVDVVLDTPVFGGGTTRYEMFAVDAPIVTWPGAFARSRITYALYRQMEMGELVARNAADYVALALRLAADTGWRDSLRATIRERKSRLYENAGLVRELERFLVDAVGAAARGRKLDRWPA